MPLRPQGGVLADHEPSDPEYSILKQRLARRLTHEGVGEDQVKSLDLVALTKVRGAAAPALPVAPPPSARPYLCLS